MISVREEVVSQLERVAKRAKKDARPGVRRRHVLEFAEAELDEAALELGIDRSLQASSAEGRDVRC